MPLLPGLRAELRLHEDVQSYDDEWSGVTDPAIRRKLQNRLNQRAARRRKAEQQRPDSVPSNGTSKGFARSAALKMVPLHKKIDLSDMIALRSKHIKSRAWHCAYEAFKLANQSAFVSLRSKHSCQRWYEVLLKDRVVNTKELAERLACDHDCLDNLKLPADHLISLVYYNVYRALLTNVQVLGLDINLMYADDYPSPFLPLSPTATSSLCRLPPTLEPTELQKTIAHHPMWDIFPSPEIRDNILRYGETNIDDWELCLDLVGNGDYSSIKGVDTQETNGVIIWGEPWDPTGWEVTECFARKWPILIRGAIKVQETTNNWRVQRGEEPLDFERILEVE